MLGQEQQQQQQQEEAPVWDRHVPVTTLRTPRAVLERRLLYFDRDQHLSASIITHAQQVI